MEKQLIVNCKEDNRFEQDRDVAHSCNRVFQLEEQKTFYVESLYYGDEMIGQFYTICPYCGYIVLLEASNLSYEQKISAQRRYETEAFQYKKNSLISQLINLESRAPKTGNKVRARTIY